MTNAVAYTYSFSGHGHPADRNLYFYLPNGNYAFNIEGMPCVVTVDGAAAQARPGIPVGVSVNGMDIAWGAGNGWNYNSDTGALTLNGAIAYTLFGSSTVVRIVVPSGETNQIALDGLHLDVSNTPSACAFSIASNATVSLNLRGGNTLFSGSDCAGLQVPQGATLVIATNSTGSLSATGGRHGAGIGGGIARTGGNITISGGAVTATGRGNADPDGNGGARIGGGGVYNGPRPGDGGTIVIDGNATVIAMGGEAGAGIGGGGGCLGGIGGTIRIGGNARVTATGSSHLDGGAAGIGGGGRQFGDGMAGFGQLGLLDLPGLCQTCDGAPDGRAVHEGIPAGSVHARQRGCPGLVRIGARVGTRPGGCELPLVHFPGRPVGSAPRHSRTRDSRFVQALTPGMQGRHKRRGCFQPRRERRGLLCLTGTSKG